VIVPAVRDDDRDVQDVLAAGADDVFLDSLADGLLRNRLLVAQRLVAQRASAKGTSLCVHGAEFERFFDLCRDLLAIAGFDGHFKKVNQAWTRTLGWTTAELLAEPSLNFVHPDDRDKTLEARSQLASRKPLGSFTNRYRSRDGSYRWLEWQIAPSGDGALVHAAARDVTDAQIVKDLTRELTESLATTLDSLGDGVIATDVEGRLRT
jgi:PAS domain S-box-containing protein